MLDLFTYSSLKEVPSNISYHYKRGNMNWPMIIYISLVHMVAVMGLFSLPQCSRETLLWAFLLWPIRYVLLPYTTEYCTRSYSIIVIRQATILAINQNHLVSHDALN